MENVITLEIPEQWLQGIEWDQVAIQEIIQHNGFGSTIHCRLKPKVVTLKSCDGILACQMSKLSCPAAKHIILPTSATEQGHAFEDLILSHYHKSGRYTVREWSSYLHGASGKWWQCDGIVEDSRGRYLPVP